MAELHSKRMFAGKAYKLGYVADSKEGAAFMKLRYKRNGLKVRVTRSGKKHHLYVR